MAIERMESDGTVVYTDTSRDAMAELGCPTDSITFDGLEDRSRELSEFYDRITTMEDTHA